MSTPVTFSLDLNDRPGQLALKRYIELLQILSDDPECDSTITPLRRILRKHMEEWILLVSDGVHVAYVTHQGTPALDLEMASVGGQECVMTKCSVPPKAGLWLFRGQLSYYTYSTIDGMEQDCRMDGQYTVPTRKELDTLGVTAADWVDAAFDQGLDMSFLPTSDSIFSLAN